jgi:pilus assembly protein Flp/PilA
MKNLYLGIQRFIRDEEGVTAIEYALIAALIAVVIIAAVKSVGVEITNTFTNIATELQNAPASGGGTGTQ